MADEVCPGEPDDDRQRDELLRRCREERIESPGRLDRILGAARRLADERFCEATVARLSPATIAKLEELVAGDDPAAPATGDEHDRRAVGGGPGLLAELKADPGGWGWRRCLRRGHAAPRARTHITREENLRRAIIRVVDDTSRAATPPGGHRHRVRRTPSASDPGNRT